ncbi:MAG: ABC transporter ATP-binding protein [Chloroflexota bacterium]|nr:ABC transporter ATP-binding protein [Chloroflexota bacterium]
MSTDTMVEQQTVGTAPGNAAPSVAGVGRRGQAQGQIILEASGLTKRFKSMVAVDDLNLSVRTGEVLGFLGPNGAGKSTTVGMILGLIRPSSGTVRIAGQDLTSNPSLVSENIGAIIENPAFYPYMSGRDNLRAHAMAVGKIPESRIDSLLELVNLSERARHKYKTYSLGMKQRLGIASTLLTDPALVILDEPTNGLDPAGQREIRAIIPRLADQGHGVLLASHMLHEVEQVSDRVLIVRRGKLITEGSVDDLLRRGGYIEVSVPGHDPELAQKAIRPLQQVEQVTIENGKLIVVAPEDVGSALNRALVEQGIFASTIAPKHSTLEDLFLELTDDEEVPA